jgi:hypothetical protein
MGKVCGSTSAPAASTSVPDERPGRSLLRVAQNLLGFLDRLTGKDAVLFCAL